MTTLSPFPFSFESLLAETLLENQQMQSKVTDSCKDYSLLFYAYLVYGFIYISNYRSS